METSTILQMSIEAVRRSRNAFCKFISANDAGKTGGHQEGFYMPKDSIPLMFETPGKRGENMERVVKINWQNDFITESRFIYYGKGTRNEYRLTRFGRGFPFLQEDNVGDLLILCHIEGDQYEGFILSTDDEFELFFAAVNITAQQTNRLLPKEYILTAEEVIQTQFIELIASFGNMFPTTEVMAREARRIYNDAHHITSHQIIRTPDSLLLEWNKTEYELFRFLESHIYKGTLTTPFNNVEQLVEFANSILNRRKSRAGRSLEHHLGEVFTNSSLKFDTQGVTEMNKRPDFLFPGSLAYHDLDFSTEKLIFLGAKTTCKDRWRQVITEANRIQTKHLFTLQQGISKNQLAEMFESKVQLVVPEPYLKTYDRSFHDKIWTLNTFVEFVKEKQKLIVKPISSPLP